jgi:hypothetical protein
VQRIAFPIAAANPRKAVNIRSRTDYVWGDLGYVRPMRERAFQTMYEPAPGAVATNCVFDMRSCQIHDARQAASAMSLEETGFTLLDMPSKVKRFHDEQEVTRVYYPEVTALALEITGGVAATAFDHVLREREADRPPLTMGRPGDGSKPAAVGRVHNDYTESSGVARLGMVYPRQPRGTPFMILNFWRPIIDPAIDTPLALCDCRSFSTNDWLDCEIIYPTRIGQIYLGQFATSHRWHYYPKMLPTELLVFKTYDSRGDIPARMTPHCAFDDVTADPDAPPRRSMEIRCLVLLE